MIMMSYDDPKQKISWWKLARHGFYRSDNSETCSHVWYVCYSKDATKVWRYPIASEYSMPLQENCNPCKEPLMSSWYIMIHDERSIYIDMDIKVACVFLPVWTIALRPKQLAQSHLPLNIFSQWQEAHVRGKMTLHTWALTNPKERCH